MARNPKVGKKNHKPRPVDGKGRVRRGRPKVCLFCTEHATWVDYKDLSVLRRYVNDRGRIKARGATGTCAQHQRDVAVAIKTARELALLPYVVRTMAADAGDRRGGFRRGRPSAPAGEKSDESSAEDAAGSAAEADAGASDEQSVPLVGVGAEVEESPTLVS
jgi:small subunit ribosomal protein S18